jgi:hypothetical protein
LREIFARILPQASFQVLKGVGHPSALEAPQVADACAAFLDRL